MPGLIAGQTASAAEPRWQALADDHVHSLAWSPDGAQLALGTAAGTLFILDAATGHAAHTLAAHRSCLMSVAWSAGGLATGGQDGLVKVWDASAGRCLREFPAGAPWVEQVAWSPDAVHLAAAAGRGVRVWDAAGELVLRCADHRSTVAAICWRPDGRGLAAGCYGGVHLYRLGETASYSALEWKGSIIALTWSPNARYIAAGSQEATIQFWKLPHRPGEELFMHGYATKVRELAWDPGSRFLASGGGELITIWDVSGRGPAGTRPRQLDGHSHRLTQLAWQHRGLLLASADLAGGVRLWDPRAAEQPLLEATLGTAISALAWAPDDRHLAAAAADGTVACWTAPAT